ncbi:MAG: metallophosphoesterase [Lachnospiraceae bacterium]|nr:metallophosphoesterase [Lachnospiraceae bacterium]
MKCLIVSDSHGRSTYLNSVLEKEAPLDMVLHLGDIEGDEDWLTAVCSCPVEIISGNNDYFSYLPKERLLKLHGLNIWMTHGHRYRVHTGTEFLRMCAMEKHADIVLFGHTHRPHVEMAGGVTIVNPGSISQPRQANHQPSYIIMQIGKEGRAEFDVRYVEKNNG